MLKNSESHAPTETGQQGTTTDTGWVDGNFNINHLRSLRIGMIEEIKDFFYHGGITMPLEVLHLYACELSEYLHTLAKEQEKNEDERDEVEGCTLKHVSDVFFRITFIMYKLSSIYEAYERYKDFKEKNNLQD